ncbi:MAG: response regulator transcription factor [Bacteroidales bacterium]|nr:response regulator transcription factor [Bacteroidales bacterium]
MPVKIFIVDDHFMVIEGIKNLLSNSKEILITGYALNAKNALESIKSIKPELVLMDINLPDISGVELCKLVKKEITEIKIIGLSTFNQLAYVTSMIENGASGYLLKNSSKEEILEAIQIVMSGNQVLSPEVAKMMKSVQASMPMISRREKDVLKCICMGLTSKEISEKLFISINTVNTHRKSLMLKLNVNKTADLISNALKNEFISLSDLT